MISQIDKYIQWLPVFLFMSLCGCQYTESLGRPLDQGIIALREVEKIGRSEGGTFQLANLSQETQKLYARFNRGYFQFENEQTATLVLIEDQKSNQKHVEHNQPAQVLVTRYFWRPRAQTGRTHLDPNATNSTMSLYIFSGKEVGIYRGAGMTRIFGDASSQSLRMTLLESHLNLTDQTLNFHDLVAKADFSGSAVLTKNPTAVHRTIDHVTRLSGGQLGYLPIPIRQ